MSSSQRDTTYYYVRPTDSLFVRGNLAFGDSGEHGASMMPPSPSLFAGAFRSALLGNDAEQTNRLFATGPMQRCPGLANAWARQSAGGLSHYLAVAGGRTRRRQTLHPKPLRPCPPTWLLLGNNFATLQPRAYSFGVQSAGDLPLRATLVSAKQEKPQGGVFLRGKGLTHHLQGQAAEEMGKAHSVESKHIYQRDPRLGIGLNADARTAEEGQIYTTEGFAFSPST